jgi:hypothetical protein
MKTLEAVPDPISLMESMRALGYTPESAIADLIDNSISANSTEVDVFYEYGANPYVAVLDDGDGMSADRLHNAMRHGSTRPSAARAENDLGRFGLGLKTASLSQCRKLTVVSKTGGLTHARCWDLDLVEETRKWLIVVPEDLESIPKFGLLKAREHGTLVVWQELDRLLAGATDPVEEIKLKFAPLFNHLALVFHRFREREDGRPPVVIRVNGLRVGARDPFLSDNPYRQPLEPQELNYDRGTVLVSPVILPPINRLTLDEVEMAGGAEGLRGTQGFYVYRNRRLVIWGTWFRLVPKSEFLKLTRVRVDIPNTFDDLWALDIKKSAAHPPEAVRNRLKALIPHFAGTGRKTITYAGRRKPTGDITPAWLRVEPSYESYRYEINPEYPLIVELAEALDADGQKLLQGLLPILAASLPLEAIYADRCSDGRTHPAYAEYAEVLELCRSMMQLLGFSLEKALKIDPVCQYPKYHAQLRGDIEDAQS